ncbi:hypothetical protein V6N13_053630 [Hibiscus sabdariffa]
MYRCRQGDCRGVGFDHQTTSLFVENLPESFHRKGLWHLFGRQGEVMDDFIANKISRRGMRFGFVRFSNKFDAGRPTERLNGLLLYGNRISVSLVKYNVRHSFWKKVRPEQSCSHVNDQGKVMNEKQEPPFQVGGKEEVIQVRIQEKGESCSQAQAKCKSIKGHVETDDLWKLKRYLIGDMASVCSVRSILLRLQTWGLGEIKILRMGEKMFLISIEDDELFLMLEDLNWLYLKEIFVEVKPWSENLMNVERATWLEVTSMPLHCWNLMTFKKIAKLWGKFEALGANANRSIDSEKMTILVSTNLPKRIDEYVELEVSNCIYFISVVEKGFTDNSTVVEDALGRKEDKVSTMHSSGSQSDSSSETNRRQTQDVDVGNKLQSVDEATNAVFLGKEKNIDYSNRFLGECDLLGTNCIDGHEASRVGYVKKDTPTLNMKDGLTDECLIYA